MWKRVLLLLLGAVTAGCAKSASTSLASPGDGGGATQRVYGAIREDEQKRATAELGKEARQAVTLRAAR